MYPVFDVTGEGCHWIDGRLWRMLATAFVVSQVARPRSQASTNREENA